MKRSTPPPLVYVPPQSADRPAWAKVGVVAAVGFLVGVVWPRLAGLQLGPSPPNDAHPSSSSATAAAARLPGGSPGGAAVVVASAQPPGNEESVAVGTGSQTQCRDAKGNAPDTCDTPSFDTTLTPAVKGLAKCPSAIGLAGKLAVGLEVDFRHKTIKVQRGKSTTLPATTVDGVMRCLERSLAGISLDPIAHDQTRYSLVYSATFYPPGKSPDAATTAEAPKPVADAAKPPTLDPASAALTADKPVGGDAGETADVSWNTCNVREQPTQKSETVGKVTRGMKVKVLEKKGEWVRVQFGSQSREGWIFHEALGL